MPHLFFLELRLLARDLAAWLILVLFAAALGYGIWNGTNVAERTREAAETAVKYADDVDTQVRAHLEKQAANALTISRAGSVAVLPPAPLPLLATGQSDVSPGHESVVLWQLGTPSPTRSELENPSHLLAGRFDLAFVLVWLYPLFLLALVYDLMASDREAGTLRLALSQGIAPWRWMARRALARGLPILTLAAAGTLVAGLMDSAADNSARLTLAVGVVLAYGLFWIALAMAVNAVARSGASAATALGAAWVAFVLVAPSLLNVTVESLYPTPSRPELVAQGRRASGEAQKRGGELLDSFYRDHPELAPPDRRSDFAAQRLAVQNEVAHAIEPVEQEFDEQLARQQTAVGRWRFVSPAIAAHEALTDLAGTGYWRHRAFHEQVDTFKDAISDYYAPKVHQRQAVTLTDYEQLPRFAFREEEPSAWMSRVGYSLVGILALCVVLGAWTGRNLRAARMGQRDS